MCVSRSGENFTPWSQRHAMPLRYFAVFIEIGDFQIQWKSRCAIYRLMRGCGSVDKFKRSTSQGCGLLKSSIYILEELPYVTVLVHVPRIAHGVEMNGFLSPCCLLGMSKQNNSAWSCEKMWIIFSGWVCLGIGIPLPKSHLRFLSFMLSHYSRTRI